MHNNYYFLRKLSEELNVKLPGFRFGEVFSQNKDELIFLLYRNNEEFYIKAHLDPKFCCLSFPDQFQRAKRNSVDLFDKIIEKEIISVVQTMNDRSFFIQLTDGFSLLFKMYGNRSNIILLQETEVADVFKRNLQKEKNIVAKNLSKELNFDKETFLAQKGDYRKIAPTFGNSFDIYFEERQYSDKSLDEKWHIFHRFMTYLEDPEYHLSIIDQLPVLKVYKNNFPKEVFTSPIEAINSFFNTYIRDFHLNHEKNKLINTFEKQIRKDNSYLASAKEKLKMLEEKTGYQLMADLLMAYLHQIPGHAEEVTLNDFYTSKPVTIKLKPSLSPEKNAQNYYRKAKKEQIEVETIKKNIKIREESISHLHEKLSKLLSIEDIKALRKEFSEESPQKNKNDNQENSLYHKHIFMDYEILVGRGNQKNDALTFQVAHKDDLFLHVKDAPGAHVIIRQKPGQNFPKPVIEKAASLAAYHSKLKNNSLCSVSYTFKKYVRKPKGFPAGKVIIEKEKVVLVPPSDQ